MSADIVARLETVCGVTFPVETGWQIDAAEYLASAIRAVLQECEYADVDPFDGRTDDELNAVHDTTSAIRRALRAALGVKL